MTRPTAAPDTASMPDGPPPTSPERDPLARFVAAVTVLVERQDGRPGRDEAATVDGVRDAMRALVARDDWLPDTMAEPHPEYYRQYLLHVDPDERFSVVSFVWGPGQKTPVHDHCTWGVIGMLRGAETGQAWHEADGRLVPDGVPERLEPGDVTAVSPTLGDIHVVANAFDDRVSISIHAYGADIGKQPRHAFDPQSGARKHFISGYANRP